ncbi:MAG: chemotaxis protein CheW [Kofleriaceae bacterium]
MLIARVGSLTCALPIEHVVETMRPLPVEPRGDQPFVKGLSIIRGEPTVVIDTAVLLATERANPTRFVVVRAGSRKVALTFDAVLGVENLGAKLTELPPLARTAGDVVRSIGAVDRDLYVVLEAARLVEAAS